MPRYRPPSPRKSAYITPEGFERLRRELDWLWRVRRPEVTRSVAEAAAHGDRSENAEYIYGKKQLGEIDRRVRYLSKRLDELNVVRERPQATDRVFFGVWFEVENEAGETFVYRIVGPDEIEPSRGWISVDSPFARAALGKAVDEEFVLNLRGEENVYVVTAVWHEEPPQPHPPPAQ